MLKIFTHIIFRIMFLVKLVILHSCSPPSSSHYCNDIMTMTIIIVINVIIICLDPQHVKDGKSNSNGSDFVYADWYLQETLRSR